MSLAPLRSPRDVCERLQEARVLMNDLATRPRAVQILEEIVSESAGGRCAAEALELLQACDAVSRPPERRDPATEAMREEWLQIHRPWDGRLPAFLERLRQGPLQMDALLPRVVPGIRAWLAQGSDEIRRSLGEDGAPPDRQYLDAVIALAEQVAGIPRLAGELREDLVDFLEVRFGLVLNAVAAEIRQCCAEWAIDRAWELMKQLGGRPAIYESEVRDLETMIGAADALRAAVESTLRGWPEKAPKEWAQLRMNLETVAIARRHEADPGVPAPRQRELHRRVEAALDGALQFLRSRAAEAESLDGLRDFWRHYQRLRPWEMDARLEAHPDWFGWALGRIEARLAAEVMEVESPAGLESLGAQLRSELIDLPEVVVSRLAACAEQIERLGTEWRRMEAGEEFTAPDGLALTHPALIPPSLSGAVPRYRQMLELTRRGRERLQQAGDFAARQQACEEALEDARTVLAEVPKHGAASRLQSLAEARKLQLALDQALGCWDVEGFYFLFGQAAVLEPPYQDLAGCRAPLQALKALAGQARLASTFEAASWWRNWRSEARLLPMKRPESLERVLQAATSQRRSEWILALDSLLAGTLPAAGWHEVAQSLSAAADEPGFEVYAREILRREMVARIEALLEEKRWVPAGELVAGLEERDPDRRRLCTRLAIGRAREAGGSALARELAASWSDVTLTYRGEAYALLESALASAWKSWNAEDLRSLMEVARRVLRSPDAPQGIREPLQDWLAWLEIQTELEEKIKASGLRRLLSYCLEEPRLPRRWERLEALVDRWREKGPPVALAWAYRAFPELFDSSAADPAEALAEHREQLAEQLARELQSRDSLSRDELAEMLREVTACEQAWNDLEDFFSFLSRPGAHRRLSSKFLETRDRLAGLLRLMDDVDRLESADLRQEPSRDVWKTAWQLAAVGLFDVPAAVPYKERLERLQSLTRLNFYEGRVRRAATLCGDRRELDAERQFEEARQGLQAIIERFERAGRIGGGMWQAMSAEYWREIPALAGDLLPPPEVLDLNSLAHRCMELEADEQRVRQALEKLSGGQEPFVTASGGFVPANHVSYLDLYPRAKPGSRRALWLFDRFARIGKRRDILRASAALLPAWISEYLMGGVP